MTTFQKGTKDDKLFKNSYIWLRASRSPPLVLVLAVLLSVAFGSTVLGILVCSTIGSITSNSASSTTSTTSWISTRRTSSGTSTASSSTNTY